MYDRYPDFDRDYDYDEQQRRFGMQDRGRYGRWDRERYGGGPGTFYDRERYAQNYGQGYGYGNQGPYGQGNYGQWGGRQEQGPWGRQGYNQGNYGYGQGGYNQPYGNLGFSGRSYPDEFTGSGSNPRFGGNQGQGWNDVYYMEYYYFVPGPHTGKGPRSFQRSDEMIRDDINNRLTQHGHIDASDINVTVKNGEVTLTGTVEDRQSKRLAEDIAESVTGVKDVHNQLHVQRQLVGQQTGQYQTSGQGVKQNQNTTAGSR